VVLLPINGSAANRPSALTRITEGHVFGQRTAKLALLGYRSDLACLREKGTPFVPNCFLRVRGRQVRLRMPDLVHMARDDYLCGWRGSPDTSASRTTPNLKVGLAGKPAWPPTPRPNCSQHFFATPMRTPLAVCWSSWPFSRQQLHPTNPAKHCAKPPSSTRRM
jgi:hypothetical protein